MHKLSLYGGLLFVVNAVLVAWLHHMLDLPWPAAFVDGALLSWLIAVFALGWRYLNAHPSTELDPPALFFVALANGFASPVWGWWAAPPLLGCVAIVAAREVRRNLQEPFWGCCIAAFPGISPLWWVVLKLNRKGIIPFRQVE